MKTLFTHLYFKLLLVILIIHGFSALQAQNNTGVYLSWDKEFACQIWTDPDQNRKYLEDIEPANCMRVCKGSEVVFELHQLPSNVVVTWYASGGVLQVLQPHRVRVNFTHQTSGELSFSYTLNGHLISRTLCIEKLDLPEVDFMVNNMPNAPIVSCYEESLVFTNLSISHGSEIVNYLWDFGDGSFSYEPNPVYTYSQPGFYQVSLVVTNACGCSNSMQYDVEVVPERAYAIECPTVVCENSVETYHVSFDAMHDCSSFTWQVEGGEIINEVNGIVQIIWNQVDASGFGYVTFVPEDCNIECRKPTTVKIPVILSNGTIQGSENICSGVQERYQIPAWPTTDVTWTVVPLTIAAAEDVSIFLTDQRNEVAISTNLQQGTFLLKAMYHNTLLGCSGEATMTITIKPKLELIGVTSKICVGEAIQVSNSLGVPVIYQIYRLFGTTTNQLIATVPNVIDLNHVISQVGKYYVIVNSSAFCDIPRFWFDVLPKPAVPGTISGPLQVCPNIAYTYAVSNPNSAMDYEWSILNNQGQIIGSAIGTSVQAVFQQLPAQISVRAIHPELGCYSDPRNATIQPIPLQGTIVGSSTVCPNSVTLFQLNELNSSNLHQSADSYHWSLSDPSTGSVSQGQGTNTIQVTWNNSSSQQSVQLIATLTKCTLPAVAITKTLQLLDPAPMIQINGPVTSICGGASPLFIVSATNGINIQSAQVSWRVNGQPINGNQLQQTIHLVNTTNATITTIITAQITGFGTCGVSSNVASFNVEVLPNPPAVVSIVSGGNVYCSQQHISTQLSVATNSSNVTFQWFRGNQALPNETNANLLVNSSYGFGSYYCVVTHANGCVANSNSIDIIQNCNDPDACTFTVTPDMTNSSFLMDCTTIQLQGNSNGTFAGYDVYGPPGYQYHQTTQTVTGPVGLYHTFYQASYLCTNNNTNTLSEYQPILIPYEPDLRYSVSCLNNNQFELTFFDNSTVSSLVDNYQAVIQYRLQGATTWTTATANQSINLTSGNYELRITLSGTSVYHALPNCTQNLTMSLAGIPNLDISFIPIQNLLCHDSAVEFSFSQFIENSSSYNFLWSFESGITNTLPYPKRVFNAPGTYPISVVVTNQLGCSRTFQTSIVIPEKCFEGSLVASPANATVCQGQAVTITYQSTLQDCAVQYLWMHNDTPMPQFANQNSITVSTPGYYWLQLIKPFANCRYEVPNRIAPKFTQLPKGRILCQEVYCTNEEINLGAKTYGNVTYSLYLTELSFISTNENLLIGSLPVGTYEVVLEIHDNTTQCVNYVYRSFTVVPQIESIALSTSIENCAPYEVRLTANALGATHYLWSNGVSGNSVVVNHGGVYQVTAYAGGCAFSQTIQVPRHPSEYAWSFPSGCLEWCEEMGPQILGPLQPIRYIGWEHDREGTLQSYSYETHPTFDLPFNGSYHAYMENDYGCAHSTAPLQIRFDRCDKCDLEFIVDNAEVLSFTSPYLYYQLTIPMVNATAFPIQLTMQDPSGNFLLIPSTVTLQPGLNQISFQVVPLVMPSVATNLSIDFFGSSFNEELEEIQCINQLYQIPLEPMANKEGNEIIDSKEITNTHRKIQLYPNPTSDLVTIEGLEATVDRIVLYDMQGRKVWENSIEGTNSSFTFSTNILPKGLYLVVVSQQGVVVSQHKLVKN